MKEVGIGVDIGGSHIVCCAVDMGTGKPIEGTVSEEKVNNKGSKDEVFTTWSKAINSTIELIEKASLRGIGFAMPGAFNYKTAVALYEGNDKYENLYGVNLKDELPKYLSEEYIELRFINDATAFAIGEVWYGQAKDSNRSIAITLGTGFGSALIDEDIPIVSRQDVPLHGCFWHLPFKNGIADDYFSTRWFVNTFENKSGQKASGVKDVAIDASGSGIGQQVFDEFSINLVEFLAPWLNKFMPDTLVIGGNVSKAIDLFLPRVQEELSRLEISLQIYPSDLMEEAALIGSARLLDDTFWRKVKLDLPEK
ncbi:MAG: ROK family protein [Cyclobacteriaceae bacterium]